MLSSLPFTRGGSMAPRSERVVLSRPSSLPGHSDSPNARDRLLPVSSGLQATDRRRSAIPRVPCSSVSPTVAGNRHRLRPGEMRVPALPPDLTGYIDEERPCENAGVSGAPFMSPSPHAIGLTPGSRQVRVPFASLPASAFPKGVEGRRISWVSRFLPQPDSPDDSCPATNHEAAPFASCYGLRIWQVSQIGYDPLKASLLDTVSGQVPPRRYHLNAPPAYAPEREIGAAGTFTLQDT